MSLCRTYLCQSNVFCVSVIFAISSDLLMHQINHRFIHEVVNIFHYQVVHIFIHQERGDELLIRGAIRERSLGTDSGSVTLV